MARGSKRLGLSPEKLAEGVKALDAAHEFLVEVAKAYPIKFGPETPYGAAHKASEAIREVKEMLTGKRNVLE